MPSSATDRFTIDFEYVFFFTKSRKYCFKQQLEPYIKPLNRRGGENLKARRFSSWDNAIGQSSYRARKIRPNPNGRNKRCVWRISTRPFPGSHFAAFPEQLCEIPIKAGCPKHGIVLDPFIGSGTTGLVSLRLSRNFIGFDINPEYCEKIASKRITKTFKES